METKFRQWTDMIVTPPPSTSTSSSTTSTPPSTLDFKIEAKQYFHSTVIMSSTNSSIENVSYEAAMASLLQTLQPCFAVSTTTTTKHIYLALSCIVGALQALTPTNETTSTATATTSSLSLSSDSPATVLSVPLVQLWSTFLLTYMGPITLPYDHNDAAETHEMDSSSNDYDIEQIRDVAMEGLTALITHCGTSSTNTGTSLHEWIPFLCSMAQQGVDVVVRLKVILQQRTMKRIRWMIVTTTMMIRRIYMDFHNHNTTNRGAPQHQPERSSTAWHYCHDPDERYVSRSCNKRYLPLYIVLIIISAIVVVIT